MQRPLESHKLFPYVAWLLIVSFAAFTGNLALQMQREIDEIGATTDRIEQALIEAGTIEATE